MQDNNATYRKIADAICPRCQGELIKAPEQFSCRQCGASYQVVRNVPILYKEDHRIIFEPSPVGVELPLKLKLDFLKPMFSLKLPLATRKNLRFLRGKFQDTDRLLIIGGGMEHYGWFIKELGQELFNNAVNLEIAPGPFVDLVADAQIFLFPTILSMESSANPCWSIPKTRKESSRRHTGY